MVRKCIKMKKKSFLGVLILSLTMGCVPVFAADSSVDVLASNSASSYDLEDGRASYYIASYYLDLVSNDSGSATVEAEMLRIGGDFNKITLTLQQKINGSWQDVDDIRFTATNELLGRSYDFDTESGKTYRVKGRFEVFVGSSSAESRTIYTDVFTGR